MAYNMTEQILQWLIDDVSVVQQEDKAWLLAQDILRKLSLSPRNASKFLDRHVSADYKTQLSIGKAGRPSWYVTEEGAYQLGMQASTVQAISLQRWIFGILLPSIRKKGGYISSTATVPQAIALSEDLAKIISPTKRPWSLHFKESWQKEACRLCKVSWKHPRMGQFINQTVYDFFDPKAIAKIRELNANGQLEHTAHHQYLTEQFDAIAYQQHLRDIEGYMLASPDLSVFWRLMDYRWKGRFQLEMFEDYLPD